MPTCPAEALYFGDLNDPDSKISKAMADVEASGEKLQQLRAEKGTVPRTWFAGDGVVESEERVPRESESYGTAAYDIYNWPASKGDEHASETSEEST